MAFVVPCISIVVCYARIFYIVRKTALRSHDTGSSMGGNSMHCQSNRAQNNNHVKKIYTSNNNKNVSDGTDIQLLPRSDDVSGDSGRGEALLVCETSTRSSKHLSVNNLLDADNSSSLLSHSQSHGDIKSGLRLGDNRNGCGGGGGDGRHELKLSGSERNLSNVSISRTVEFIEANGERHNLCSNQVEYTVKITQDAVDSAIEESSSSTENNQVGSTDLFLLHVGSLSTSLCRMLTLINISDYFPT